MHMFPKLLLACILSFGLCVFSVQAFEDGSSPYTQILESYLTKKYPAKVTRVEVLEDTIAISLELPESQDALSAIPGGASRLLVALPLHQTIADSSDAAESIQGLHRIPIPDGTTRSTQVSVPRFENGQVGRIDRALFRWALVQGDGKDESRWISQARYADSIPSARPSLPEHVLRSKKGLGGWTHKRASGLENDIDDLGISAITINVAGMHHFLSLTPSSESVPYVWQDTTYHFEERRLAHYDELFREAAKKNVMVSAILLINNPIKGGSDEAKLLAHPDATREGHYAMPNVLEKNGMNFYGALIHLMAERWTREDAKYGRVHHWILHNEVDFGWVWTNAGKKSDVEYMDMYHRSMRMVNLIVRQYDLNASPFISLTHHWTAKGDEYGYGSKRMLELLLQFCQAEGDFNWGLAHHPYPQDLFEPKTWEDNQSTFDLNSEKITPRNLEVLDHYMHRPELLYQGRVRKVHLSENGFNSRDYTEPSLADQAAGMALAWHKVKKLPSLQIWHYHNWVDHPDEGGLRIGLRKFPKAPEEPFGKKPIWYLYQSLGTPTEEQTMAPYLKTIGIERWEDLDQPVKELH